MELAIRKRLNRYRVTATITISSLWISLASAQCAPGIPTSGNPGCIPPNQANSPYYQEEVAQSSAATTKAVWSDRWGAIAFGHTSILGTSKNQPDQRSAESSALDDCRKQGGQECVISISYHNQCGAVAWGTSASTTARAPTAEEAASDAMITCRSKTSDCQIYYQNCTYPVRVQ